MRPLVEEHPSNGCCQQRRFSERLRGLTLRRDLAPGPSGPRISQQPGDARIDSAIRTFAEVEVRALWTRQDHILWCAAIITPSDAEQTDDPNEAQVRKLRPNAQLEVMLKRVETSSVHQELNWLRAYVEPHSLRVATLDGSITVVKV